MASAAQPRLERAGGLATRVATVVAGVAGVGFLAAGAWAFFAPEAFFEAVATFEPYNPHLVRDIGAFQLGLGAVLVLAVVLREALLVALGGTAVGAVFHLVGHVLDRHLGGNPAVDIPAFGLLAVLLVAAAVARARTRER